MSNYATRFILFSITVGIRIKGLLTSLKQLFFLSLRCPHIPCSYLTFLPTIFSKYYQTILFPCLVILWCFQLFVYCSLCFFWCLMNHFVHNDMMFKFFLIYPWPIFFQKAFSKCLLALLLAVNNVNWTRLPSFVCVILYAISLYSDLLRFILKFLTRKFVF